MICVRSGLNFRKFPHKRNLDVPAQPNELLLDDRFAGFVNYDESDRLEKHYRQDPNYVFEKKFFENEETNSHARVGNYHLELSVPDYERMKGKVKKASCKHQIGAIRIKKAQFR